MTKGSKLFKYTIISFVSILILGYGYYQTKNLMNGPILIVNYPISGMTLNESLVEIRGLAKNASFITLNDRKIFVDEEGKFKESLLLSYGYNVVEVEVTDKFERTKTEKLELIYKPK